MNRREKTLCLVLLLAIITFSVVNTAVWVLFDGIVTLILGYLIWVHWPSNLAWVLGTLIGISLMFSGISRFMLSHAFPRLPLS